MIARDWKRRTAKRGGFNQSLFEHSIYELDALCVLWPILSQSWGLNDGDFASLVVGIVVHDVGKETPEWQAYVLSSPGQAKHVPHVVDDLTQAAVDQLFEDLGLQGSSDNAKAFVRYHMQATKTADSLLFDAIYKGDKTDRWMTLSKIVDQIDNVCSANGLLAAIQALEKPPLGKHLKTTYHLVQLRGVSTTLLHRAAVAAYEAAGWSPLLHYSNGTLYVASSADEVRMPTVSEIEIWLTEVINQAMKIDYNQLIVGNPTTTVLPKPELFDYHEIGAYLTTASTRVSYTAFLKRSLEDLGTRKGRKNTIKEYLGHEPTEEEVVRHSQRLSDAYPEISVFCFFKAAFNAGLIGDKKNPQVLAEAYETVFGSGTFEMFKKSSAQLSPARHMKLVIDPFWELPGSSFGLPTEKVWQAPNSARMTALISALEGIASKVYAKIKSPPQRIKGELVAQVIIQDLLYPTCTTDIRSLTSEQLLAYCTFKRYAGCDNGKPHICPLCNQVFSEGILANDSLLDKPGTFTNRIPAHGRPNGDVLCNSCKYEIFLQQILLGGKPAEMLVLLPRMNIGQGSGAALVQKAHELLNRAMALMSADTQDPNEYVSLSLTQMIAKNLADHDVFRLSTQELLDLFTHKASDDTRKKARKALEDALREEFGDTVDDLNAAWGTNFATWDEAVEALIARRVTHDTALSIRADVYKLQPTLRIVCQTPHMILIPLRYPMAVGKDAEVNKAIRELFTLLILGLALDCSVAVLNSGETIAFEGGEGVAMVPRVPALRDLVGSEWVSLDRAEEWLRAIGAASLLAQATGLPARSNLYQILSAPTPGHILRRIEQNNEIGTLNYQQLQYLEILKEVLR